MLRIRIVAVGRLPAGPLRQIVSDYLDRLGTLAAVTVREVEVRKALPADRLRERQAELLLAEVPPGAVVVVLDERGRDLASTELADRLRGWQDGGVGEVAFLLGGADGHADTVRRRADLLLAFGRATWPHLLARVMLAEQLYRASTILSGHPYHRA